MTAGLIAAADDDRAAELARWSAAAILVLAIHLGLVALYLSRPSVPQGSAEAPAIFMELAPITSAPEPKSDDVAPGPQMQQSLPPAEPKASEDLPDKPKPGPEPVVPKPQASPMELAPENPAATVVAPSAPEKPAEKKPEVAKESQARSERTKVIREDHKKQAPKTTAPPSAQVHQQTATAAPNPGASQSSVSLASWRDMVAAHLQRYKRYPSEAQARHEQGSVYLSFTMNRNGRVVSQHITRSSGIPALDQEVLAMIQRAQPLPSLPPSMPQAEVTLVVPIQFSLR